MPFSFLCLRCIEWRSVNSVNKRAVGVGSVGGGGVLGGGMECKVAEGKVKVI